MSISAILLMAALLASPVQTRLRGMSLLVRFSNPQATGISARFAHHLFREEIGIVQTAWGPLKYRLYTPLDTSHGGIVLLHGIHQLGIEEPRLINFARALAETGVEVMTPELRDLTDYHVTLHTVDLIGRSANFLSIHMNRSKVGVVGLSFAGGLALLAAAKPEYSAKIGIVLAIGAHDDLARIARFFATDTIEQPDGSKAFLQAHEYGYLIIAYSHVEDFFSSADVETARKALRLWLSEDADSSGREVRRLSPEGQGRFEQLLHHREQLSELLQQSIRVHASEMAAVSPHGQLQNLSVPVYLLHAAGDNVIPASETLWLSRDIPKKQLRTVLISPALVHANVGPGASFFEQYELLDFLARILTRVDRL
jgi:dienelactone hydrolase